MNTKIKLKFEGIEYILEYNRYSVKLLESKGFKLSEFLETPMTSIEMAFQGAFIANHPKIKIELVEKLFHSCPKKDELVKTLTTMIQECYESLLEEPSDDEGNATWEVANLAPQSAK